MILSDEQFTEKVTEFHQLSNEIRNMLESLKL